MTDTLADAIKRVFVAAVVDCRAAARREDKDTVVKLMNLTSALEEAYPRQIKDAYIEAGVITAGQGESNAD